MGEVGGGCHGAPCPVVTGFGCPGLGFSRPRWQVPGVANGASAGSELARRLGRSLGPLVPETGRMIPAPVQSQGKINVTLKEATIFENALGHGKCCGKSQPVCKTGLSLQFRRTLLTLITGEQRACVSCELDAALSLFGNAGESDRGLLRRPGYRRWPMSSLPLSPVSPECPLSWV